MRLKTRITILAAAALVFATGAFAQPSNDQPSVPHAHYGRDGFWHCDDGYVIGESGACEVMTNGWHRSAFTRLREFERADMAEANSALRKQ
jgi:hypothetical protein